MQELFLDFIERLATLILLPMTGDSLARVIQSPPPLSLPLVEDFLHANSCFMLTGETGKGKSVLAAQLALSLSSGTPLFSSLAVPHPVRVYYMQLEGSFAEQVRRLHFMQTVIPLNANNLYWDSDRTTAPLTRYDRIARAFSQPPQVVILDPIYKLTGGDLAKAEPALQVVRFSDHLMSQLGCAIFMLHHPHRDKLNAYGKKIEEEDFYYGHSFLKNHLEISYVFKPLGSDGERGQLILKKRREENTLPILNLVYHPETYTCSMLPVAQVENKRQRVDAFLKSHAITSFKEVCKEVGIQKSFLRELQTEYEEKGVLAVVRDPGKPSGWVSKFGEGSCV
mgnify:CR=1 FL=1